MFLDIGIYKKESKEYTYLKNLSELCYFAKYKKLKKEGKKLVYHWLNEYFSITRITKGG